MVWEKEPDALGLPAHIKDDLDLYPGDLKDMESLLKVLKFCQPDEIYNLAARTSVTLSWEEPFLTSEITAMGPVRLLEGVRQIAPQARFFQPSSSEIFGNAKISPQTEQTPLSPRNPYGWAKAFAHKMTAAYRERYGLFASIGILYNHESPRRPETFVTRKISRAAARIKAGLEERLILGDISAVRDWGYAKDYVRAFWLMLQQSEPDDFIIASGQAHTVEDFCRIAFEAVGLDYLNYLETDSSLYRRPESVPLIGNPAKAKARLGWQAELAFPELVRLMVQADLKEVKETG